MENARSALDKTPKLLDELRSRNWTGPLTSGDVSRLLNCRGRVAGATLRSAVAQGFLCVKVPKEYVLTRLGEKAIATKIVWGSPKANVLPSASVNSITDSRNDQAPAFVNESKDSRRESAVVHTTKESSILYNNNINIIRASARSKPSAKKTAVKRRAKFQREQLKEQAKQVIAASKQGNRRTQVPGSRLSLDSSVQQQKVYAMALAYENQLGVYQNNPTLKYLRGMPKPGERGYDIWLRASMQSDHLGVSYDFYVRAQFYWFDKWFSRAPKAYEMASYKTKLNASERVRMFEGKVLKGSVRPSAPVLGRVRSSPKPSEAARFLQSAGQLQTLMANYEVGEEEVLRVFAKNGQAHLYFDRAWLQQNETYRRLKEAGEL